MRITRAEADVASARTLLADEQTDLAAFLVQQALEKTLKALLVAAARDVRRTHDIEALATLARIHWPVLVPAPFPLAVVSLWYVTTRYPGLDEAPPTAAEVSQALAAVIGLISDVMQCSPKDMAGERGQRGEESR